MAFDRSSGCKDTGAVHHAAGGDELHPEHPCPDFFEPVMFAYRGDRLGKGQTLLGRDNQDRRAKAKRCDLMRAF